MTGKNIGFRFRLFCSYTCSRLFFSHLNRTLLTLALLLVLIPAALAAKLDTEFAKNRYDIMWNSFWTSDTPTLEILQDAAQNAEKTGKRRAWVDALVEGSQGGIKGVKRTGGEAVKGRGWLSDEDLTCNSDEAYEAVKKRLKAIWGDKLIETPLGLETPDDVMIWRRMCDADDVLKKPEMFRKFVMSRLLEKEYAPFAASEPLIKGSRIGEKFEAVMDNLNKGRHGYLKKVSSWVKGMDDKAKVFTIWDEYRLIAKDTFRSLEKVGLAKHPSHRAIYEKYKKIAKMQTMPEWFKPGMPIDDLIVEAEKARRGMLNVMGDVTSKAKGWLDVSMNKLRNQFISANTVDELTKLRSEMMDVCNRLYRVHENHNYICKSLDGMGVMDDLGVPLGKLDHYKKYADEIVGMFEKTDMILQNTFVKYIDDATERVTAIRHLMDPDNVKLEGRAVELQQELGELTGLHKAALEEASPQTFIKNVKEQFPDRIKIDPADETVCAMLRESDSLTPKDAAKLFGDDAGKAFVKVRDQATKVNKASIISRFKGNNMSIKEVNKNLRYYFMESEFGDVKGGRAALVLDGVAAALAAMYQTSVIMETEGLSLEEENLQIQNAWISSMPGIGEMYIGVVDAGDAYYEGDWIKGAKSGIWLTIGVAYFVPGAQIGAVVATLGMVGAEVSWAALEGRKDKLLVETWLASGDWDPEKGTLKGIYGSDGLRRPVPPHSEAFRMLVDEGDVPYHADIGLVANLTAVATAAGVTTRATIRESIHNYAEKMFLDNDTHVIACRDGLENLYPDFELYKYIREPLNIGRTQLSAHIIEKGGTPRKDTAYAVFVALKRLYNEGTKKAIQSIKYHAEQEYQARNNKGDAKRVFTELKALEKRMNLPLIKHVKETQESWSGWAFSRIKAPWSMYSIPRQQLELAKKYLIGYLKIEKMIKDIDERLVRDGLEPPEDYMLSGYLNLDEPRVTDLAEKAFPNARKEARDDLKLQLKRKEIDYEYDLDDPCCFDFFRKLHENRAHRVMRLDWDLLWEERLGWESSAIKTRDIALQEAEAQVDQDVPLGKGLWDGLMTGYEWLYVMKNAFTDDYKYKGTWLSKVEKLEQKYKIAKVEGRKEFLDCLKRRGVIDIQVYGEAAGVGDKQKLLLEDSIRVKRKH